jgi:hypothetical protein
MCGGGSDKGPKEAESRLALAQRSAIDYNRFNEVFGKFEDMAIADASAQFSNQNYESAMGAASNAAQGVYEQGQIDMNRAAYNRGFDPSSGAVQNESAALMAAKSRGMGLNASSAGIANTDRGFQMMGNVVNIGQRLGNDSMQGQIDVAQTGVDRVSRQAEKDFMRSSSLQSIAGTGAGVAAGAASYGLQPRTV